MNSAKVIIIGAGPVGTFVAYCLAEYGIETILLESETSCETDMRASTFHPSTLKYLDNLNLANELIDKGLKAPIFQYRIRATDEILEFNLEELSDVLGTSYYTGKDKEKNKDQDELWPGSAGFFFLFM